MKKSLFLISPSILIATGILLCSTKDTQAQNGAALNSTNTTNQVNLGNSMNSVLGAQNVITVEAWVNPADSTAAHYGEIVGNYASPLNQLQFCLRRDNGGYVFFIDDGVSVYYVNTGLGVVRLNTWQHIAGVWDGSKIMIYVNGLLKATTTNVTGAHLNSTVTNSVVLCYETAAGGESFNGNVDEVRIWTRALCQGEIQNNMGAELSIPQTGLLAYYQFNEGLASGNNTAVTTLNDITGNGYNGTLTGFTLTGSTSNWVAPGGVVTGSFAPPYIAPALTITGNTNTNYAVTNTLTASGGSTYTWSANAGSATTATVAVTPTTTTIYTVTGSSSGCPATPAIFTMTLNNGAALNCINSNNQGNVGNSMNAVLNTSNLITAEAWVNPADTTYAHYGEIVGNYTSPLNQLQFLLRRENGGYTFYVDDGTGLHGATTGNGVATIGAWQHIAGVWNGSSVMIYVNGILKGSTTGVTGPHLNSTVTNSVVLGYESAGSGESFNGSLDEVRIWTRALCQGEIQNNMSAELKLPQAGLLAYYMFNEGVADGPNATVTTLADSSGNNYNGTISNFSLSGTTSNWIAPGAVNTGSYSPAFVSPTVTVSGNTTICSGATTTLTAVGNVSTFTWTAGPNTAANVVSLTSNGSFSVVASNSLGCISNTAVATVTVNPLPNITAPTGTVCTGSSFTLTPTGALTYSYSPTGPVVNPTGNTTYTITGTNGNGCIGKDTVRIMTNPLPGISATNGAVCIGKSFTITPTGGITYTYMPNGPVVTPTTTATYTVFGTNSNGCVGKDSNIVVIVHTLPSIGITFGGASTGVDTLCSGFIDTLKATGASTYTWSANAGSAVAPTTTISPSSSFGTYTVMGTDANGCINSHSISITFVTCSGIKSYSNSPEIAIYPNPSNGIFNVQSDRPLGVVEVFDLMGSRIYYLISKNMNAGIDLSSFAPGFYYMRVLGSTSKLSKQ